MDRKRTVLIVEDEKTIVDILRFNLQKEGFETLEANDGLTGLNMIMEESPDLVLLDLMLPGLNGFEVCKKVRENGVSIPVLILTAREAENDKILGLDRGRIVEQGSHEQLKNAGGLYGQICAIQSGSGEVAI